MIYIGYPGIGKSTLGGSNNCIDLESSNFTVDNHRPDDRYIMYCNIAKDLSNQGYRVFVSSHNDVINYLKDIDSSAVIIAPNIILKDEWTEKLRLRYEETKSDKNLRAYERARDHYEDDIVALFMNNYLNKIFINSMDYDLKERITNYEYYAMEQKNKKYSMGIYE